MNDFLDNLAERAMNAEQGIRPRLPSLFEPAMPVSKPAWPEKEKPLGIEPLNVTLEQEESDLSPAPGLSPRLSGGSKRGSQSGEQNDRPLMVGQRLSPAPQVFQPDLPPLLVSDRLSQAAPGNCFDAIPPKPALAPLQSELAPAVDRRESTVEQQEIKQIVNETVLQPALLRPELPSNVDHREAMVEEKVIRQIVNKSVLLNASRDAAHAVEAARNETSATLVVRPKLDRYAEPPMPPPQSRTQKQPAPPGEQVINVMIGRIEVRATPPPAATSRSNNQKIPGMSLDDYLRQRSGGRGGGV